MATFVNNLRLKEIITGGESGTWGTSTNTNLELIADAFGSGTEAIITNANTHTTTMADGLPDEGRAIYMKYTGTLDSACTITLAPDTINKFWIIENATSGSQNIIINQGTTGGSGGKITIGNGKVAAIFTDGAGTDNAAVLDAFADLELSTTLTVGTDVSIGDDLTLGSDAAVLNFGADSDVSLTHVADIGLLLNSTRQLQFNATDNTQYIAGTSATVLSIRSVDEIDLTATAVDLNGTLDVSGITLLNSAIGVEEMIYHIGDTTTWMEFTTGAWKLKTDGTYAISVDSSQAVDLSGTLDVSGLTTLGGTLTVNAGAVFNEAGADVDFRIEGDTDINMFVVDASSDKIGIGTATPNGKFEIWTGDSSASPDSAADELVIESSGSGGISILTATSGSGSILFGDSGGNGRGKIYYDHSADNMKIAAGGTVGFTLSASQDVTIAGDLVVSGTGPHAIGGAAQNNKIFAFQGALTSGGAGTDAHGLILQNTLTGASGDTARLSLFTVAGDVITQTATEDIGYIASATIASPDITKNLTGDITIAASLYIIDAPTEGEANASLYIAGGTSYFGGEVGIGQMAGNPALSVKGNSGGHEFLLDCNHSSPSGMIIDYSDSTPNGTGNLFLSLRDDTATRGTWRSNGGIANYSANNVNLSDERLKIIHKATASKWDAHAALEVFDYNYTDSPDTRVLIGVGASQAGGCDERLCATDDWEIGSEKYHGIYSSDLSFYTMKTVQECQARIVALETALTELQGA